MKKNVVSNQSAFFLIKMGLLLFLIPSYPSYSQYSVSVKTNQATTYYVSTSGRDGNPGTKAQPWRNVDYAVKQVKPGDTVLVEDGTYDGPLS